MRFTHAVIVALVAAAANVSALSIQKKRNVGRWAQDLPGETCESCTCDLPACRISLCPDDSKRTQTCLCPLFVEIDVQSCAVKKCADGEAPDSYCMCPSEEDLKQKEMRVS